MKQRLTGAFPALHLFIFVGMFWASQCAANMGMLLLRESGLGTTQIGMVLSVNAVLSIICQPLWGMLSDQLRSVKKVFVLCLTVATLFLTSIYFAPAAAVPFLLMGDAIFRAAMTSLSESWTLERVYTHNTFKYGTIRVSGSFFYAGMSFIYANIMNESGAISMLPLAGVVGLVTVALALTVPYGGKGKAKTETLAEPEAKQPSIWEGIKVLVRTRRFLQYLIFAVVMQSGTAAVHSFLYAVLEDVGGSAGQVGTAQGLRALMEVPAFLLGAVLLNRMGTKRMIYLGGGLFAISFLGMFFAHTSALTIASFAIAGLANGALLQGKLTYVRAIAPPHVMATAITMVGACEFGVGSIIGNSVGGRVAEYVGAHFLPLLGCGAITLAVLWLMVPVDGRKSAANGELG